MVASLAASMLEGRQGKTQKCNDVSNVDSLPTKSINCCLTKGERDVVKRTVPHDSKKVFPQHCQ